MDSVLGAQATDQRQGFMKVLISDNDDRILGFTMIGAAAGEVMAAVQTAMLAGLPYQKLRDGPPCASDHGGGTRLPLLECATPLAAIAHIE
jgi:pyruvate/2-oxoglutarate dehydrogenase complex dihydrolipoamide dehydrogenase (E3) component